ncbi:MAG TPA: branched-chain amino acid ABC transporter permease [Paracoccaceae bacterium]|nr:branched-chain amino acid ABC transporter permease [Paracoccaceae bacterium]
MDPQTYGYIIYGLTLLTMGGIYAVLVLGLNIQWGYTGHFNAGVAGFVAVGAYTQALLTTPVSENHIGGIGVPIPVAMALAMVFSAAIAWGTAKVCIRLRADYLAIATIGIAEILRLIFKNELWATNGPRGVSQIPKAFDGLPQPWDMIAFLGMVLGIVAVIYLLLQRAQASPWGRVMSAIRDNEEAASAVGKDVEAFRMESFVLGAALMGLGGALLAQYLRQIGPNVSDPLTATFLVWVMLIAGGSGNNRGALLGAFLLWAVWSMTQIVSSYLPNEAVVFGWEIDNLQIRSAYFRVFLIGLILQFILQLRPQGILPERRPAPDPAHRGPQKGERA